MVGDRSAVDKNDIAIVDTELLVQHAADDAMTGTEPLHPHRLLETRVVTIAMPFGERPLRQSDLALRVPAIGKAKSAQLDRLTHALPNRQRNICTPRASGADPEIPFIRVDRFLRQRDGP